MTYRVTKQARRDLLQIWNYIADDNDDAADRFISRLTTHFRKLGRNPYLGRSREELRRGYRSFPVGQYVIFYRLSEQRIEIMHVLHGKRDLDAFFE